MLLYMNYVNNIHQKVSDQCSRCILQSSIWNYEYIIPLFDILKIKLNKHLNL